MDRTTARHLFNEFSSVINLSSSDGIMRSSDVDRYIENALKPLFDEGKAFKHISINRRTGSRTTRYAYQGGKKIQDSINSILRNMYDALGYAVDPSTGTPIPNPVTGALPPMTITNQGRHYYDETRERILDPKTAASIRAQAIRLGGWSETDKATGFTTTLVRAGLHGGARGMHATSSMRRLVDDTDTRYLAGELPSSALADGASPASISERARAQVNRRENIRDARQQAEQDYIDQHPDSQLAMERAARLQNVTDRATRQRVLAAERTPGTPEFRAAADRRLNRRAANDEAMTAWAKRNRSNPVAKAILKNRRNRTASGRVLNKVLSMTRFGVIGALLSVISTAVGAMVKFLSALPAIASNVHNLATKSSRYNVPEDVLQVYEQLGRTLTGNESGKEMIGNFIGVVHNKLASVFNGDIGSAIGPMAALSARVGSRTIYEAADYYSGNSTDITKVMHAAVNDTAKATFSGMTGKDSGLTVADAASRNMKDLQASFNDDAAKTFNALYTAWKNLLEPRQSIIANKVKNGDDFITLMATELGASFTPYAVSGSVPAVNAENVGNRFRQLGSDAAAVKEGILIKIMNYLDPVVDFLRQILRAILSIYAVVTGDGEPLQVFNDTAAINNMFKIQVLNNQKAYAEAEVNRLREEHGLLDESVRKKDLEAIEAGRVPYDRFATWKEAIEWYGKEIHLQNVMKKAERYQDEAYLIGRKDASGTEPEALAGRVQAKVAKANKNRTDAMVWALTTYGTAPSAITTGIADLGVNISLGVGQDVLRLADVADASPTQRFAVIRNRFPTTYGSGDGVTDTRTGKTYHDPKDHLDDLVLLRNVLQDARETIPHDPEVSATTAALNYRRANVGMPRTISESQALVSHVADQMMADFSESFIRRLHNEGIAPIEIKLSADKSEHYIIIKNTEGRELGRTSFTSTPATQHVPTSTIPWTDVYEAFSKQ